MHEDRVLCLAVLLDGRVVSGSGYNTVRLRDPQTGTTKIIMYEDWVECQADLPDGSVILGRTEDKTVRMWDPVAQRVTATFPTDYDVESLACSSDSSTIHAGLANGEVLFLEVEPQFA